MAEESKTWYRCRLHAIRRIDAASPSFSARCDRHRDHAAATANGAARSAGHAAAAASPRVPAAVPAGFGVRPVAERPVSQCFQTGHPDHHGDDDCGVCLAGVSACVSMVLAIIVVITGQVVQILWNLLISVLLLMGLVVIAGVGVLAMRLLARSGGQG